MSHHTPLQMCAGAHLKRVNDGTMSSPNPKQTTRCSHSHCLSGKGAAATTSLGQDSLDMALIEICTHRGTLDADHIPCMLRLLDAGADPLADFNGVTPLAQRLHDSAAQEVLRMYT